MFFHRLKIKVTFAVIYTSARLTSCFVTVEYDLNAQQTHELIENRKIPDDAKQHIQRHALNQLSQHNIFAEHIIKMRVIKKEINAL